MDSRYEESVARTGQAGNVRAHQWVPTVLAFVLAIATVSPQVQAQVYLSNIDERSRVSIDGIQAQSFTTGPATDGTGFNLAEVRIAVHDPASTGRNSVSIWSDNGGEPGRQLFTLTDPPSILPNRKNIFVPPANTVLAQETTYWVVSGAGTSTSTDRHFLWITGLSPSETGASGWSFGSIRLVRNNENASWVTSRNLLRIEILGPESRNLAPMFSSDTVTRSIAENTRPGENVGDAIPAALDPNTRDTLFYTMEGTDRDSFVFDAANRQIRTKTSVDYDYEMLSSYTLTIKVQDGVGGVDSVTVIINLTDVDEPPNAPDAPVVSATSGSVSSLDVSWTAPDNSGKPDIQSYDVRYCTSSGSACISAFVDGPQDLAAATRMTTITGLVAGTNYGVQVRATNTDGDGDWSATGEGTTSGTPNNAPVFPVVPLDPLPEIDENTAAGAPVGGAVPAATDADTSDTLTYSMEGEDKDSFEFNTTTRQITTKMGVIYDYEAKSTYSVTIRVEDGNGGVDTFAVSIMVGNVDEPPIAPAAPVVSPTPGSITSLEVSWTAPDNIGKPAIDSYDVRYCAGSVMACTADSAFTLRPQDVTVTSARIANLTANTTYQIQVRATNVEGDSPWSASGEGVTGDFAAPALAAANVNDTSMALIFNERLEIRSVPSASAFTVSVAGSIRALATIDPVRIEGKYVILTLSSAVAAGETVTVSYVVPMTNPLRDVAGNEVAALTTQSVTNNTLAVGDAKNFAVRLVDKDGVPTAGEVGRVEVYHSGAWGLVCDDRLDNANNRAPTVMCRNAGDHFRGEWISNPREQLGSRYAPARADQPFKVDDLVCGPGAGSLDQCSGMFGGRSPSLGTPRHNCRIGEEVWLRCSDGNDLNSDAGPMFVRAYTNRDGIALYIVFDTSLRTSAVPSKESFEVTVDGEMRRIRQVHVGGTTRRVEIFLYDPIRLGDEVTVSYADPNPDMDNSNDAIEDLFGDDAISFGPVAVENLAADDGLPPRFTSGAVSEDGLTMTLHLTEKVNQDTLPSPDRFNVCVVKRVSRECREATNNNFTPREVLRGLAKDQLRLQMIFAIQKVSDDRSNSNTNQVKVNYTDLTSGNDPTGVVQDYAGNDSPTRGFLDVENSSEVAAGPVPTAAATNADGDGLTITFGVALDTTSSGMPAASTFEVSVDGQTRMPTTVMVSGMTVTIGGLSPVIAQGQNVTVTYTDPGSGNRLKDADGDYAPSFVGMAVSNDSTAANAELDALTALFEDVPTQHTDVAFSVTLAFSEEFAVTEAQIRAGLVVTGGEVTTVAPTTTGQTRNWTITVTPSDAADPVTITLTPKETCSTADAICTSGGRGLQSAVTAEVPGRTPTKVVSARVTSDAGDNGTWETSETVTVEVAFSSAVGVYGNPAANPTIGITLDGTSRNAALTSAGSVTPTHQFSYTVTDADAGAKVVRVVADSIAPDGAVFGDNEGYSAVLDFSTPGISASDVTVIEGPSATAEFTLTLDPTATEAVTVTYATADGTAIAGDDYTSATGTVTFNAGETSKTVSVRVLDDAVEDAGETFTLVLSNPQGAHAYLARTRAIATINNDDTETAPLTAGFSGLPTNHAGQSFTFELAFSEAFPVSYVKIRDHAFQVTGGTISAARRVDNPHNEEEGMESNRLWNITVEPTNTDDVSIALPTTTDCDAVNAICTSDDRPLSATVTATVPHDAPSEGSETPFTVRFEDVPSTHAGSGQVTFRVVFNKKPDESYRYQSMRDDTLVIVQGTQSLDATRAKRLNAPHNDRWEITVDLLSKADLTMSIDATTDCEAVGAVCTADGEVLTNSVSATILGPPRLAVSDASQEEGSAASLEFSVTLSHTVAETVTVAYATADGTANSGTDYTAASGTLTFAAGTTSRTVSVALLDDTQAEDTETLTLTLSNASGANAWIEDAEAVGTISDSDPVQEPFTASFSGVPDAHDGSSSFTLDLTFSTEPAGMSYITVRDALFTVSGGTIERAKRHDSASDQRFRLTVAPSSPQSVSLALATPLPACGLHGSVCTTDGRSLEGTVTATILGPPGLSVAGAQVEEGSSVTADFAVTLSRPLSATVTVDYSTTDGTAVAGVDYTQTSGVLTFSPGETAQTISVPVLDDAHDEGAETFTLTLSNPSGGSAYLATASATGTISNSDPLPKAWLTRFARASADQAIDAINERLQEPDTDARFARIGAFSFGEGGSGFSALLPCGMRENKATRGDAGDRCGIDSIAHLGGITEVGALGSPDAVSSGASPSVTVMHDRLSAYDGASGIARPFDLGRSLDELLLGSGFRTGFGGSADDGRPRYTAWGRASATRFGGEDDGVALDGDVSTFVLGGDASHEHWMVGAALSRSLGSGTFWTDGGRGAGVLDSRMTTVLPYAQIGITDTVNVWSVAGLGYGDLKLQQKPHEEHVVVQHYTTDIAMQVGALGVRGEVFSPLESAGLSVVLKSDAFWMKTESEAVTTVLGNLRAAAGDASRIRLLAEGSRSFEAGEGVVTPSLELGIRHDSGDAENGKGIEFGGALKYERAGINIEGAARTLVAHEEHGYREWSASASVNIQPSASESGLLLSFSPTWGTTARGIPELWGLDDVTVLTKPNGFEAVGRMDAKVAYGFGMPRNRGLVTPYAGVSVANGGGQTFQTGLRWELSDALIVDIEASRAEQADENPIGAILFQASMRW